MTKRYQVSDGKLLLTLHPQADGWFVVTSPTDPAMITEARSIDEAFANARDAFAALAASRADPTRWNSKQRKASARRQPSPHRPVGAGI